MNSDAREKAVAVIHACRYEEFISVLPVSDIRFLHSLYLEKKVESVAHCSANLRLHTQGLSCKLTQSMGILSVFAIVISDVLMRR